MSNEPICSACNDTHRMTTRPEWACTRCPVPCQKCRQGGTGPFCASTPCACECHAKHHQYAARRAAPMPSAAPLLEGEMPILRILQGSLSLYDEKQDRLREVAHKIAALFQPSTRSSGSADLDPAHCSACAAFVARNAPPGPKVEVKNELWTAANLKAQQLQREINESSATSREKSNLQHTLSKLWMFATDAWDHEVVRPAQRKSDQEHVHAQHSSSPFTRKAPEKKA